MRLDNSGIRGSQRTFLGGKIVFNNRSSVFDCVVRRISDEGAVLQLVSNVGVPRHFELRIGLNRSLRACEIAWRNEGEIGVAFLDDNGRRVTAAQALSGRNVVDFGHYRQAQKAEPLD